MTIKTLYKGGLRTEMVHLQSNTKIETDAPTDNHGKGERFSPTDLVAGALCSCMMTFMGITAERENIDLNGLSAEVTKVMSSEAPRRIVEVIIRFDFSKILPLTDIQKVKLENAIKVCPVGHALHPDLKQTVSMNW